MGTISEDDIVSVTTNNGKGWNKEFVRSITAPTLRYPAPKEQKAIHQISFVKFIEDHSENDQIKMEF
jgi:hypothetical protein